MDSQNNSRNATDAQFTFDTIESLSPPERQTLSVTRLIVLALLMGASLFMLVVAMRITQQAAANPAGTSSGTSGGQAALSTVVMLQLGWSIFMLLSVMGYPILRGAATRALVRRDQATDDESLDNTLIARGYMTATLIGAALAEGLSMLGTTILLLSGRMFNLTLAAVPLLAFMFLMPTTSRLFKFRRNIQERRSLSLGP